jgi:nicotinate-nucleotide adenylyltransferase
LRDIRAGYPGQTICLILGADSFNRLKGWKSPKEILQLAHLVVCQRPGVELDRAIFSDHWVESPAMPGDSFGGSILPLAIDENPCSSTKVRDMLEAQESEVQCLHPAVFEYIQDHHLYH